MAAEILQDNPYNILICEDNIINQKVVRLFIEDSGFNCNIKIVENGKMCVDEFNSGKYHLIFLDIGLPDISGKEVARIIRLKNKTVPIIAYTAMNQDQAMTEDFTDIMVKPTFINTTREILEKYLHNETNNSGGGEGVKRVHRRNIIRDKH